MPTLDQNFTSDNIYLSRPISTQSSQDPNTPLDPSFAAVDATLAKLLTAVTAPNTRRAYAADLDHFLRWGGVIPASPLCVARYLAAHAETHAPARSPMKDTRDRALLLVGFAGALRRSELTAAECQDVEWRPQRIVLMLPRSKTDQEGQGRSVAIPHGHERMCPVDALKQWLEAAHIANGPLFRPVAKGGAVLASRLSGDSIAAIVKQRVAAIGLDPSCVSGHSLRAGFATSAAEAGAPSWKIRTQTGHTSDAMMNRYIRVGELFSGDHKGRHYPRP